MKNKLKNLLIIIGTSSGVIYVIHQTLNNKIDEIENKHNQRISELETIHNQRISELETIHNQRIEHLNNIQELALNNNLSSSKDWLLNVNTIDNSFFEKQYLDLINQLNIQYLNIIKDMQQIYDFKLETILDELYNLYDKINNDEDLILKLNTINTEFIENISGNINFKLDSLSLKFKDLENSFNILEDSIKNNVFDNIRLNEKFNEYVNILDKKLITEDISSMYNNMNFDEKINNLSLINKKLIDLFEKSDSSNKLILDTIQELSGLSQDLSQLNVSSEIQKINNDSFNIPSINEPNKILPQEIIDFVKNHLHIDQLTDFHIFCILILMINFVTISVTISLLYTNISLEYREKFWQKLPQWIKILYNRLPKWYKKLISKYPIFAKYGNYFNIFIILYLQSLNIVLVLFYLIIGLD